AIATQAAAQWAGVGKQPLDTLLSELDKLQPTAPAHRAKKALADLAASAGAGSPNTGPLWQAYYQYKHDCEHGNAATARTKLAELIETRPGAIGADSPRPLSLLLAALAGGGNACAKAVGILAGAVAKADLTRWAYIDVCLALQCI